MGSGTGWLENKFPGNYTSGIVLGGQDGECSRKTNANLSPWELVIALTELMAQSSLHSHKLEQDWIQIWGKAEPTGADWVAAPGGLENHKDRKLSWSLKLPGASYHMALLKFACLYDITSDSPTQWISTFRSEVQSVASTCFQNHLCPRIYIPESDS